MADASPDFSVVLAGGGCKTFWGMGVLRSIADLLPPIDHFAGTSAGAIMALVKVAQREDPALEHFLAATRDNPRNFYPRHVLRGRPVFPHEGIVRDALRFILAEGGYQRIMQGPPVHILQSYVAPGMPTLRTGIAAFREFDRRNRIGRLHGPQHPTPGLGVQVVRSVDASDPEQLLEWVLMSSTAPPVTRMLRRAGRRYLDGALVDNVPVRALPESAHRGRILVLLSAPEKVARRALRLPTGGQILYLGPADFPPVKTWDYTSPAAINATYELGQREGAVLRRRVEALLAAPCRAAGDRSPHR
ncbi:MAG: patatin-like phospholipase family protein [Enhygromyxa sp.]